MREAHLRDWACLAANEHTGFFLLRGKNDGSLFEDQAQYNTITEPPNGTGVLWVHCTALLFLYTRKQRYLGECLLNALNSVRTQASQDSYIAELCSE